MMDLTIELKTNEPPTDDDLRELESEVATSLAPAGAVGIYVQRSEAPDGAFGLLDPTVFNLVCNIASGAAVAASASGLFRCIAEWLKSRGHMVTVTVGDLTISAPQTMVDEDVIAFAQKVAELAQGSARRDILHLP